MYPLKFDAKKKKKNTKTSFHTIYVSKIKYLFHRRKMLLIRLRIYFSTTVNKLLIKLAKSNKKKKKNKKQAEDCIVYNIYSKNFFQIKKERYKNINDGPL